MNTDPKITELETITVPEWIPNGDELTIEGVHALSMADVILVSNPIEKMNQYGDSILDYLDTYDDGLPVLDPGEDWQSYCAKIIQRAIEAWAEMTAEEVPDLDAELEFIENSWQGMRVHLDPDDQPALDECFNNWTDSLCTDGEICQYTYKNIIREDVENA